MRVYSVDMYKAQRAANARHEECQGDHVFIDIHLDKEGVITDEDLAAPGYKVKTCGNCGLRRIRQVND